MSTATQPQLRRPTASSARAFVERVLDELEVAERAYHHLDFALPLVADLLLRTLRRVEPGDRVLLIGGSTLLAESLLRSGFDLDIWQFPNAHMTDGAKTRIQRTIRGETLSSLEPPETQYDLIILPLVLEAVNDAPAEFLQTLRKALAPDGALLVATANQSRLDVRLAALFGGSLMPEQGTGDVSLGWPALSVRRHYHRDELVAVARQGGFRVERCEYTVGQHPFLHMELLNVHEYAARKLRQLVSTSIPPLRDVLVTELTPRYADRTQVKTDADELTVSVFVSARRGGEHLRRTLDALLQQTHPKHLYEVVVLHDGTLRDVTEAVTNANAVGEPAVREIVTGEPDGPIRRNMAMLQAKSDISAHTDDSSTPPADWIRAAAVWFDVDTAVVTGPVFPLPGSQAQYLDVPGIRPDPGDKGIWSEVIFPISNVFYRTAVAFASGGFDAHFSRNGGSPAIGWDTELAWRIQRSGWRGRFREEVFQFRLFTPEIEGSASVQDQMRRASELPQLAAKAPEFANESLVAQIFASKQTMYFDLALAGITAAAAKRNLAYLMLCVPYLGAINPRVDLWPPSGWPRSAARIGQVVARQATWLVGFVRGSVKARKVVL